MNAMTMKAVRAADGGIRHVPTPFLPEATPKGKKKRIVPDPIKTNGESAAEQLRLLIERVERIDEEIKGLQDDRKDVLAEAASRGYVPATIKAIVAIRKKDKEALQEEQAILETYLHSLGML